jgi:hypothetical protein
MQLPTIKIREKATGRVKIINQTKYADDIAAYSGWEIISMRHGNASDAFVAMEREQERIEEARKRNSKSPASKDAQLAFEARSDGATVNTNADATNEQPHATDVTSATNLTTPVEVMEERQVPVIGGMQTVRVRGRKPKHETGEGEVL